MNQPIKKVDTITIKMRGTKKFRQAVIDLIHAALMDENLQFNSTQAENGYTLESTIAPSEEIE